MRMLPLALIVGCASEPQVVVMSPVQHLTRASLDLRGVRPSPKDVATVRNDPSTLETLVSSYAEDPRFGHRVAELMGEVLQTYDEDSFVLLDAYEHMATPDELFRSIGQEPLEMIAHLADHDRSYAELVTGSWTMANEVTARIWPVEHPGGTGWVRSRYTDDRPPAGVLATNGIWWQYGSMLNNLNRGRANAYSRIFLCEDFLDSEIGFRARPIHSEAALEDAVRTDPACSVCHERLDPLAAHFFGFWYFSTRKRVPQDTRAYHPERELAWRDLGLPGPAFRGQPTRGLADLGAATAADPAYAQCFAQRSLEGLLRRPLTDAELPHLVEATLLFRQSRLNIRALYRHLVQSDLYRADAGARVVSPTILGSVVYDLTGFRWERSGLDLMRAPGTGVPALGGAADGVSRDVPLYEPSMSLVLIQKRLAESAAAWVAETEMTSSSPTLLTRRSEPVAQLQELHMRILGESLPADDPAIAEELALFEALAATDETQAWAAIIAVLLQDPRLVVY